ncbi:AAA family ATPase [Saprospiraceae bacterium]|nr:AAA family ATPase [Saprospiraceae bacterium]
MLIDNVELDKDNAEFNYASDFVQHTDKLVYLTGKAGTGKTTFLKYLNKTTTKNTVILAPTGAAAVNAGGQTIHSFFQIRPSIYVPNDKRLRVSADKDDDDRSTIYEHFRFYKERLEIIRNLELLILDEVSMIRCDLLDVIDRILRVFRRKFDKPFGGVQVVLIGDTFQLSPIAKPNEWSILSQHYSSPYFFSAHIIRDNKPVYIELKKIYRQNEMDFINLLNKIRVNKLDDSDLKLLNQKYNPQFVPSKNENYITLATHNATVDSTNITRLTQLEGEEMFFEATVTGNFPDRAMPTARTLQLKEGAQIMFVKNDKSKRYYNGKIAKLLSIVDENLVIELSEGNEISIDKQTWQNIKYSWNEKSKSIDEEIIGTFSQYPIKLAWAITVHKSQGLTFENVIADLGGAFSTGQVYVALSRCTSFSGLVLKSMIGRNAIKTSTQVLAFAQNETPSTLITKELESGKTDFFYRKVRNNLQSYKFDEAYENLNSAIKLRNDFGTDTFRRYFNVFGHRFRRYKKLFEKSEEDISTLELEMLQLKTDATDLKNQLDKSEFDNEELVAEKNSLGRIVDKLKLQLNETENLVTISKEKNRKKKNMILELESEIEKLKSNVLAKEKNIEQLSNENKRILEITWFQKLIGRK